VPAAEPSWDLLAVLAAIGLVLLVVAAFLPCLKNDFVSWDDDKNFLENLAAFPQGSAPRWGWLLGAFGLFVAAQRGQPYREAIRRR
jgi:hypothetical protein